MAEIYKEYLKKSYVYGRLGATDGNCPNDNALTRLSDLKSAINTVRNFIVSNDYNSDCIEKLEGIFDASLTKIDEYTNMINDNLSKLTFNANRGDSVIDSIKGRSCEEVNEYLEDRYYNVANEPVVLRNLATKQLSYYCAKQGKCEISEIECIEDSTAGAKEGYIKCIIKEILAKS